jgi:nitroreductase
MSNSGPESPQQVRLQPAGVSLIDGLISTRAIRRYTGEPIPDRVLRDILFVATRAPSGSNRNGAGRSGGQRGPRRYQSLPAHDRGR